MNLVNHISNVYSQSLLEPLLEFKSPHVATVLLRCDQIVLINTVANLAHLFFMGLFLVVSSNCDYKRYLWKKGPLDTLMHIIPISGQIFPFYRLLHKEKLEIKPKSCEEGPALEDSEETMMTLLVDTKDPSMIKRASLRLQNDKHFVLRVHQQLLDLDLLKYVGDQIKQEVVDDLFLEAFPEFFNFMPKTVQDRHISYKRASVNLKEFVPPVMSHEVIQKAEKEFEEGYERVTKDLEELVDV